MSDIYFNDVLSLIHFDVDVVTDVVANPWTNASGEVILNITDALYGVGCAEYTGPDTSKLSQTTLIVDYQSPFTIEMSFYLTANGFAQGLFNAGPFTNEDRLNFGIDASNFLTVLGRTSNVTLFSATDTANALTTGQWYTIAWGSDGTTLTTYLNGVVVPDLTVTGIAGYIPAAETIRIGNYRESTASQSLTGYLDEMRITQVDRYGGLPYTPAAFPDTGPVATSGDKPLYLNTPTGNLNMQVQRGYGGVEQVVPTTPAVTITAGTWYTIPTDTAMLDNPLNILQDEINEGISALIPGVWRVDISLSCGFDPVSNKARYVYLRLFNITQGAPFGTKTTSITIEKNIEAFNISTSSIVEVPVVSGDLLGVQLGGSSDDLLGFTVDGYKLMATLVAEL